MTQLDEYVQAMRETLKEMKKLEGSNVELANDIAKMTLNLIVSDFETRGEQEGAEEEIVRRRQEKLDTKVLDKLKREQLAELVGKMDMGKLLERYGKEGLLELINKL